MLIHSVYFWLKPEVTPAQREAMRAGLESLRGIKAIEKVHVGAPAALPDRPIRDSSYALALTVIMKDLEAHDAYQVDPLHRGFIEQFRDLWTRVQIYDAM